MNYFRPFIALAMLCALGGCIGSRSTVPNYYLLTAQAQPVTTTKAISIGVGPVHIAQFLNRAQIVTHNGGGTLHIEDRERWGDPLDQSIQRVLVQNLAALTGAETRNFPWRQNMTPDYAVRIDVIDLDRVGNNAILDVSWSLEDLKNTRVLKTEQQQISVPSNGSDSKALANSYSELLVQLANEIASALNPPTQ